MEQFPLDDAALTQLVPAFYARIRRDEVLGPIFNKAIGEWPEHLEKLTAFWSSVMLTSGRYKGQPVPAHLKHSESMTAENFSRWLGLWRDVTGEMMQPAAAAELQVKAERIAESLQLAVSFRLPSANRQAPLTPARVS